MSHDAPQKPVDRRVVTRLPLVLLASVTLGYLMTSSTLIGGRPMGRRRRGLMEQAEQEGSLLTPDRLHGSRRAGGAPGAGGAPYKYHDLCQACNFPQVPPAKIPGTPKTTIHVLGERHTGTNAMEQLLRLNFDVEVESSLTMHKHFMQPYPRFPADYSGRLIVLTVLNVYDWVAAMRRDCYHCERMEALPLSDFLAAPFQSHPADVDFYSPLAGEANSSRLQGNLRWRPQEEGEEGLQRPQGPALYVLRNRTRVVARPFPSVLAMRRLKICQVLDLALRFSIDLEIVRLEDFLYPHHQIELMRRLHYTYRLPLRGAATETWNATVDALDEAAEATNSTAAGDAGEGSTNGTSTDADSSSTLSATEGGPTTTSSSSSSGRASSSSSSSGRASSSSASSGGRTSQRGGEGGGGGSIAEDTSVIKALETASKARMVGKKFVPQRKLRLSMYYRGTLGALDPQGRSNVTEINSRLDWQLELALQYTPIT